MKTLNELEDEFMESFKVFASNNEYDLFEMIKPLDIIDFNNKSIRELNHEQFTLLMFWKLLSFDKYNSIKAITKDQFLLKNISNEELVKEVERRVEADQLSLDVTFNFKKK